jgi:hypothetical protein
MRIVSTGKKRHFYETPWAWIIPFGISILIAAVILRRTSGSIGCQEDNFFVNDMKIEEAQIVHDHLSFTIDLDITKTEEKLDRRVQEWRYLQEELASLFVQRAMATPPCEPGQNLVAIKNMTVTADKPIYIKLAKEYDVYDTIPAGADLTEAFGNKSTVRYLEQPLRGIIRKTFMLSADLKSNIVSIRMNDYVFFMDGEHRFAFAWEFEDGKKFEDGVTVEISGYGPNLRKPVEKIVAAWPAGGVMEKRIYPKGESDTATYFRFTYHSNGKVASKSWFRQGRRDGITYEWSQDGMISSEYEYSFNWGKREGHIAGYYPDGNIQFKGRIADDSLKHQMWLYFQPDGRLREKAYYAEGRARQRIVFDTAGYSMIEINYDPALNKPSRIEHYDKETYHNKKTCNLYYHSPSSDPRTECKEW